MSWFGAAAGDVCSPDKTDGIMITEKGCMTLSYRAIPSGKHFTSPSVTDGVFSEDGHQQVLGQCISSPHPLPLYLKGDVKDFLQAFGSTKSMTVNQAAVPGLETSHP